MQQITVEINNELIEALTGFLLLRGFDSFVVENSADTKRILNESSGKWDYLAEELRSHRHYCRLKVFYEGTEAEVKTKMKAALSDFAALNDCAAPLFTVTYLPEQNWGETWKEFFHPLKVSERLLVCPAWEEAAAADFGGMVLKINPGNSFGTGQHATTRLCLGLAESACRGQVLDLGCGSGILGLSALMLGADYLTAVDLEQDAVIMTKKNAALNAVSPDRYRVLKGDILQDKRLLELIFDRKYDLICANIVAGVIIPLAPHLACLLQKGGLLVVSGIIAAKEAAVKQALEAAGLRLGARAAEDNWLALAAEVS